MKQARCYSPQPPPSCVACEVYGGERQEQQGQSRPLHRNVSPRVLIRKLGSISIRSMYLPPSGNYVAGTFKSSMPRSLHTITLSSKPELTKLAPSTLGSLNSETWDRNWLPSSPGWFTPAPRLNHTLTHQPRFEQFSSWWTPGPNACDEYVENSPAVCAWLLNLLRNQQHSQIQLVCRGLMFS